MYAGVPSTKSALLLGERFARDRREAEVDQLHVDGSSLMINAFDGVTSAWTTP